jgi:SagB-type dehydrogenase family enzyme
MRGSVRRFTGDPIALADLSALLKYGNGFVYGTLDGRRRRAIPSGGALYPAEVYVLPLECDLLPGAYHYDPHSHELARFAETAAEPVIAGACATGMALATASVAIVVSGCFERQRIKYGERAYRFTLLECGHLMQNLLLLAAGLGLGALPVGGFIDDQINNYLGLDGCDEAAVYLLLLGAIERK